jgi:hypothetical protein
LYSPGKCRQRRRHQRGSPKNNGIFGITRQPQTGLPDASHNVGGVVGVNRSSEPTSFNTSAGVVGLAGDGLGVLGISQTHNGVSGLTFNDGSKTGLFENGVLGYDRALNTSGYNTGVEGLTTYGVGVYGLGLDFNSVGLIGETDSPSAKAKTNYSGFGIEGYDFSSDGGLGNVGVAAYSNGTALLAMGSAPLQPVGKLPRPAILTICGGAPAFIAKDTSGTQLMAPDCKGNLTIAGHLTTTDSVSPTPAADGSAALVHTVRGTRATIEETGNAALTNGARFIPVSTDFAKVTDVRAVYAVFLTPGGESRGLYVTKAPNGFLVRENGGGRSNIAFDYRVIGSALRATSVAASNGPADSSLEIKELRAMFGRLGSRQAAALRQ